MMLAKVVNYVDHEKDLEQIPGLCICIWFYSLPGHYHLRWLHLEKCLKV